MKAVFVFPQMIASLRNNSHPHSLFPNKQQAQGSVLPPPTKRAAAVPSCNKAAALPALYPGPHCSLEVRGSCPHVGRGVRGRRPVGGIPAAAVGASTAFVSHLRRVKGTPNVLPLWEEDPREHCLNLETEMPPFELFNRCVLSYNWATNATFRQVLKALTSCCSVGQNILEGVSEEEEKP